MSWHQNSAKLVSKGLTRDVDVYYCLGFAYPGIPDAKKVPYWS